MDIKSKNFKNKYLVTVIILIITLSASIAMVGQYSKIEAKAESNMYNSLEEEDFLRGIYSSNYVLYKNIIEEKSGKINRPSNDFLSQSTIDYIAEKKLRSEYGYNEYNENSEFNAKDADKFRDESSNQTKDEFDSRFYDWSDNLYNRLQNLEYYAIDKESNTQVSNTPEMIMFLDSKYGENSIVEISESENKTEEENNKQEIPKNISKEELDSIKSNYRFYTVIDFDSEGNVSVRDSFGFNQKKLEKMFAGTQKSIYEYKIEPIKNTTFVYAIPNELQYGDSIYWGIDHEERIKFNDPVNTIITMVTIAIALIALLFPYKKSKDLLGFETISKIPLEFNIVILVGAFLVLYFNAIGIISMSLDGEMVNSLVANGLTTDLAVMLISCMNIIYWVAYFLIIFIGVTLLKHILSVGIREYFIKNTIISTVLGKGLIFTKKQIKYLQSIDFKEKPNKIIVIALIINFVVLLIISSMWFFGIIVAIIYTIALFILARKYLMNIVGKYNKLLKATNEIAKGNLEVKIEENLGIFEPMKDQLGSIQTGFKKAVEEEVKSQSMKTELISNVSHDLKTPLTSIITYVDLLKDENIDEEKRRLYIDTLDRKSQRLQVLIEDLFEMSKASSKNINLNIMDVDIVSLMKQTLLELKDQTSKSSLVFKNNFPQEKVILPLDSQRTFRIFENLIINISKYSMENSRVYIDIIDRESTVDIVLKNMSAVEIDFDVNDIVERFVRGDKSRNTEGSGLGLAIAKSFVELQNGKLNIDVDGDLFKVTITFNKK